LGKRDPRGRATSDVSQTKNPENTDSNPAENKKERKKYIVKKRDLFLQPRKGKGHDQRKAKQT